MAPYILFFTLSLYTVTEHRVVQISTFTAEFASEAACEHAAKDYIRTAINPIFTGTVGHVWRCYAKDLTESVK